MTVMSYIPTPVSIFAYVVEHYVDDMEKTHNEDIWRVFPKWGMVKDWNLKYRGKPGYPNVPLYIYYTDQSKKYNPLVTPTSIIILNSNLAVDIFGFRPIIANIGAQSDLLNLESGVYFIPKRQVQIQW